MNKKEMKKITIICAIVFSVFACNRSLRIVHAAALTYNFDEDVQNGLLYGSENGKVTDKDGNEIPEYDYIEVEPNGGLLMYGEVAECYSAGAGGKIVFTIPPEVDYGADSEISGGDTGYNLETLPENVYGYLIEGSESRVISEEEISSLNQTALTMAIKEIYARRGVIFNDAIIQAYFEGKNWYAGSIPENDFQDTRLNEAELKNIEILQNCIDNYVEADPNDTGDYLNMNTAYSIEELENMIGKNVRYSGILISNNIDAFTISDANYILPNVTVVYDTEKLKSTPDNSYLQECQLYVTVWGTLQSAGNAPLIEMKHICMGGSESDKGSARLISDGEWPDNYDTPIKCIGIARSREIWKNIDETQKGTEILARYTESYDSDDGSRGYLSWGKEEYQNIGIECAWELFGESSIISMTTIASFANTPVAVYGRMAADGGISIEFIEPLPKDQWSAEIEKMMEITDWVVSNASQYTTNQIIKDFDLDSSGYAQCDDLSLDNLNEKFSNITGVKHIYGYYKNENDESLDIFEGSEFLKFKASMLKDGDILYIPDLSEDIIQLQTSDETLVGNIIPADGGIYIEWIENPGVQEWYELIEPYS